MKKAIPVVAALAIASAAPALAQEYRYPSDTTPPQSREETERDQQARTPGSDKQEAGEVETLRSRSMSAPNVKGDAVPESPATGVPQPDAAGNPKSLESIPRP